MILISFWESTSHYHTNCTGSAAGNWNMHLLLLLLQKMLQKTNCKKVSTFFSSIFVAVVARSKNKLVLVC